MFKTEVSTDHFPCEYSRLILRPNPYPVSCSLVNVGTVVNGGLERKWASPVAVNNQYYDVFPVNRKLTCTDSGVIANSFRKFRLRQAAEVKQHSNSLLPPICKARYINNCEYWYEEHILQAKGKVTVSNDSTNARNDTTFMLQYHASYRYKELFEV
jgi:hypothetical protein